MELDSKGEARTGSGRDRDAGTTRNRVVHGVLIAVVAAAGLASRRVDVPLPSFVRAFAGDTLWALLVYLVCGFAFPRAPRRWTATGALLFAYAVELSQLYHAPWLDRLRHTQLGALVLGFGFLWSDLACYTAGVALGVALEGIAARVLPRRCRRVD